MSDPDGDNAMRALAVLDRLLTGPDDQVAITRGHGFLATYERGTRPWVVAEVTGETPAAALLALGARRAEQNLPLFAGLDEQPELVAMHNVGGAS